VSNADLHELARSKTSVRDFAETHTLRAKSEVGVDQARSRRQAWAPPRRQSLSSSSSTFQRKPSEPLPPHPNTPLRSPGGVDNPKPDDALHIEHLERLREIFERAAKDGNGKLDGEMFMRACDRVFGKNRINEEQLRIAFKKIDNLSKGCISWDDFCTFLYLEFRERDSAEARAKQVDFHVPAKITVASPHHSSVCAVRHLSDGVLVTCSEEGTVCFWSQELELKRTKPPPVTETDLRTKPKWVSDMALSLPHKKIILTTGDCEMQFFEMVNFEPYCQLKKLESVPLKLVCWHDPENELKSVILVGDKDGAVMVMILENIQDAFKHWKLGPKCDGLSTYSLHRLLTSNETGVKCYRWRLHTSWVTELHYFSKLSSFASCSSDPSSSLVLGSITPSTEESLLLRQMSGVTKTRALLPARRLMACDQRVFRVAKGISSADYCSRNNVIVTGSVDRLIRIWNPFMTTKPTGVLEGHTAPVFFVKADSTNSRIYSVGNDNTIRVWDTVEFVCLKTVIPTVHKFSMPTQAAHFNNVSQQVVLATDEVASVQLVLPLGVRQDMVQSHRNAISGVAYSACFNHLISACRNGVVKAWDMSTGKKVFEFSVGSCGISSIEIDKSGKRIVTGSPNGQLKVWSYNSGECLKTLDKENTREVTKTKFVSVNQNKYIVAVGWDKIVSVFPDVDDTIQQVYKPLKVWSNTSEYVHGTDILTLAFGAPHLMATASFCGKIVVWSLISYHILNQLKAVYPISTQLPSTLEGDEAVQDLVFLNQRSKSKLSASLVASGPAGYVHFWNIYDVSKPVGCFSASKFNCVTSLAVDSSNVLLLTGDIEGFLCLWRIENYCINRSRSSRSPPPCMELYMFGDILVVYLFALPVYTFTQRFCNLESSHTENNTVVASRTAERHYQCFSGYFSPSVDIGRKLYWHIWPGECMGSWSIYYLPTSHED
jgi:WD40 repeat protein